MPPVGLAEGLLAAEVSGGWVCELRFGVAVGMVRMGCWRFGSEVHTYRACDVRGTCRSSGVEGVGRAGSGEWRGMN